MSDTARQRFHGVIAALVTPFDDRGQIALDIYGDLIDHVIDQKVTAIVPASFSGEFFNLSVEERSQLLEFASHRAAGRVGVIASTFSVNIHETLALCRRASDLQCEAVLVAPPIAVSLTEDELVDYFTWIDDHVKLPIVTYNYPARFGTDLTPRTLERLSLAKHIHAYKDTTGSVSRLQEFSPLQDRFELICGYDDIALESYLWGARSILGGSACFLANYHNALLTTALSRNGSMAALAMMKKLLPLLNFMGSGSYIQLCRLGCELSGIHVGPSRRPLMPLTTSEIGRFRELWSSLAT